MRRTVVIYNPIAGGSRGEAVSARVEERLTAAGRAVQRIATRDRRGATPIAEDVADTAGCVVAVGGDGEAMAVAPDARRDSGRIHAQARRSSFPPLLAWQLVSALGGRRTPGFISEYADASRFSIEGARPFRVQVDGDHRGHALRLEVGVAPGAIRILAPRAARDPVGHDPPAGGRS